MAALSDSSHANYYPSRQFGSKAEFGTNHHRQQEDIHSQHVSHAPLGIKEQLPSYNNISISDKTFLTSPNKENVSSWLDSTRSPTFVLNSATFTTHQNGDLINLSTPSPICSPSASTPLFTPPYASAEQIPQQKHIKEPASPHFTNIHFHHSQGAQFLGKKAEEMASTSRGHGIDIFNDQAPPDSPSTASNFSSGSDGGRLLALLASKLLSYKENGRRFSRYARERSGPIDEKHVTEDRTKKPPIEEINITHTNFGLYRTASETVSDLSLRSANGTREFDAMILAAVATGAHQTSTLEDHHHQQLPEIHEDSSFRIGSMGVAERIDADGGRALVRVGNERQAALSDDEAGRLIRALTVMRQDRDSEDMETLQMPILSQSSTSYGDGPIREAEENPNLQIVPTTMGVRSVEPAEVDNLSAYGNRESSLESLTCRSNGDRVRLAMVLATHESSSPRESTPSSSSSSSSSQCKEKNMMPLVQIPASQALEKVRRNKIFAQALAYQDAKSSKYNNRYKREESKINAWENQQKIKASMGMKKVEMKLEQERAKASEKIQNEIARAHKTAEQRKASAEAVRAAKTERVAQKADAIRRTGKLPMIANVGCFPF